MHEWGKDSHECTNEKKIATNARMGKENSCIRGKKRKLVSSKRKFVHSWQKKIKLVSSKRN